jgi:Na+/H+-translocating membrane pyrophosphatase
LTGIEQSVGALDQDSEQGIDSWTDGYAINVQINAGAATQAATDRIKTTAMFGVELPVLHLCCNMMLSSFSRLDVSEEDLAVTAGLLAGIIVSGIQITFSASNAGGASDNCKKMVEAGMLERSGDAIKGLLLLLIIILTGHATNSGWRAIGES